MNTYFFNFLLTFVSVNIVFGRNGFLLNVLMKRSSFAMLMIIYCYSRLKDLYASL